MKNKILIIVLLIGFIGFSQTMPISTGTVPVGATTTPEVEVLVGEGHIKAFHLQLINPDIRDNDYLLNFNSFNNRVETVLKSKIQVLDTINVDAYNKYRLKPTLNN